MEGPETRWPERARINARDHDLAIEMARGLQVFPQLEQYLGSCPDPQRVTEADIPNE